MSSQQQHCVVIGAGMVGSSCAWSLRRAGFAVTLMDYQEPGQSTSFGNCGCISPNQILPFSYPGIWRELPSWLFNRLGPLFIRWRYLPELAPWFWQFWRSSNWAKVQQIAAAQAPLMRRVIEDFDHLVSSIGASDLVRAEGMINVYDTMEEFRQAKWRYELMDEHGFEWDILAPAELKIMAPELRLDSGMALFYPQWWHSVDPGALSARVAQAGFAEGVSWMQDKVSSVEANDKRVKVVTESGAHVRADQLVVAAGAWSTRLAKQLEHRSVPMTPKRGYHAHIADPGLSLRYPVTSSSRFFVMTPMADGIRIAGTAEFASLDAAPDYRRAQVLLEHGRHYLPNLQTSGVSEWMGQRPMMADSLPVIGRSPRNPRVLYAFGHGHYGLTQGPSTGQIIAQLAQRVAPGIDLEPYRYDRF